MGKGKNRGRYITKVGFYDIYAKDSHKKIERGTKLPKNWAPQIDSIEYTIVHAKKLVKGGFKTKDEAVNAAKKLLGETFKEVYNV